MHFFKDTKPLTQIFILLLMWLLMTIVASSLMVVVANMGIDISSPDNLLWIQFLSQLIGFVVPAVLFAWAFYGNEHNFYHFCFSKECWGKAFVAVAIFLLFLPAIDWLTVWNDGWHLPESLASVERAMRSVSEASEQLLSPILMQADGWHLLFNIIVIALCPAVCEELFFRGALQQGVQRWLRSPHWAIVITAAVFSIAHGEVFAFVPRFAMGIVLGYLFYLSGSMVVNICAHFVNNALIVILYHLYASGAIQTNPQDPLAIPLYLTIMTVVAAAALFYIYFVKPKS